MELGLDLWVVAALCAVALVAGFIDAVAGGGGLLTVPALLTAGLPPHLVLGTNKLAATFGSITASITYYRRKLFDPQFWRTALLFTAIGATCGTLVVDLISKEWLESNRLSTSKFIIDKYNFTTMQVRELMMLFSLTSMASSRSS